MGYRVEKRRVVYEENGKQLGEVFFEPVSSHIWNIRHTEIDPSLNGKGVAGTMVQMAAEEIRRKGCKVTASCEYAAHWLEKHGM